MSNSSDSPRNEIPSTTIPSILDNAILVPKESGIELSIDSALLAALRHPRERVALLRLEQALCDFVTAEPASFALNNASDDNETNVTASGSPLAGWMEVGGAFNAQILRPHSSPESSVKAGAAPCPQGKQTSFQRCLVHRLADRFLIQRQTGSVLDQSIRLIRTTESKLPSILLQDLEPSQYALVDDEVQNNLAFDQQRQAPDTNVQPMLRKGASMDLNNGKPRKMKIMKRSGKDVLQSQSSMESSSSNHLKSGKNGLGGNVSSLTEKEKAYAEARARIFSTDSNSNLAGMADAENDAASPSAQDLITPMASCNISSTADNATAKSSALQAAAPTFRPQSLNGTSLVQIEPTGTSSVTASKAVYRNRMEEATDPDFRRGRIVSGYGNPILYPASAGDCTIAGTGEIDPYLVAHNQQHSQHVLAQAAYSANQTHPMASSIRPSGNGMLPLTQPTMYTGYASTVIPASSGQYYDYYSTPYPATAYSYTQGSTPSTLTPSPYRSASMEKSTRSSTSKIATASTPRTAASPTSSSYPR